MNGKKYVINGNVHANSDIAAYLDKLDVRGKLETTGKVINYNNGVTQYIKKRKRSWKSFNRPISIHSRFVRCKCYNSRILADI